MLAQAGKGAVGGSGGCPCPEKNAFRAASERKAPGSCGVCSVWGQGGVAPAVGECGGHRGGAPAPRISRGCLHAGALSWGHPALSYPVLKLIPTIFMLTPTRVIFILITLAPTPTQVTRDCRPAAGTDSPIRTPGPVLSPPAACSEPPRRRSALARRHPQPVDGMCPARSHRIHPPGTRGASPAGWLHFRGARCSCFCPGLSVPALFSPQGDDKGPAWEEIQPVSLPGAGLR